MKLIQAKIDAYSLGLQNIKIKYNKNTNVDKYANAISNLMADNLDKALSIFISIDNYQQNPYVLELIGDLYQKKRKFEKAIELIKKYNLDMNEKIYNNENTIYHILAMTLYKINKKDIIKLFEKIQKPEKIENILLLTYDDYLNNNINFS